MATETIIEGGGGLVIGDGGTVNIEVIPRGIEGFLVSGLRD